MQYSCRVCGAAISPSREALQMYEKFGFDLLPECFICNQKHKLSFRNGRTLYRRICDATGEHIISIYRPDAPFPIYNRDYWYSDSWDPFSYGRVVRFDRPFFEQLLELQQQVPRMALLNVNSENSDYCNMCIGNKDCYCVFGGDYNESVLYGTLCMHNVRCVDCDYGNFNELCYDLFNSFRCYGSRSVVNSKNCSDCAYISDCIGCRDCILCVNLHKAQYCIENQQFSKDEYFKRKAEIVSSSWSAHSRALTRLRELRLKNVVKFAHVISCENCTGDFLENSKNCQNCFFCTGSEDVVDSIFAADGKDSFLCSFFGHGAELCYQCMSSVGMTRCRFCYFAIESQEADYCDTVINCKNVFGCIGLRRNQHCILNHQYTKEEYEALVPKIIEHMRKGKEWGEFLPKIFSCFGYNESTAQEFFPLTKENAAAQGFQWHEHEEEHDQVSQIIPATQLPDRTEQVPDDVLNWAIECERTKKPFRITKQELDFYRAHAIPLPRQHGNSRYASRLQLYSNPPRLYNRSCAKCGKGIETTYAPERPEIVYCEECYLASVY